MCSRLLMVPLDRLTMCWLESELSHLNLYWCRMVGRLSVCSQLLVGLGLDRLAPGMSGNKLTQGMSWDGLIQGRL